MILGHSSPEVTRKVYAYLPRRATGEQVERAAGRRRSCRARMATTAWRGSKAGRRELQTQSGPVENTLPPGLICVVDGLATSR
jgi:hypothetical protein